MAKIQQLICDRCKAPIPETSGDGRTHLTRYDKDYHGTRVDLCRGCKEQFAAWLDDPNTAPPGFKWQARPCAHQVPCADPKGCSGQELVPV